MTMAKYEGHTGTVEKFGRRWRWFRYGHYNMNAKEHIETFKVEPYYDFNHNVPKPRHTDKNLTLTIEVRGTTYVFPARRMPCTACDGGIRRQLKLRPHGGVCYCDRSDGTVLDFDYDRMTEQQRETIGMYHLDQQTSS